MQSFSSLMTRDVGMLGSILRNASAQKRAAFVIGSPVDVTSLVNARLVVLSQRSAMLRIHSRNPYERTCPGLPFGRFTLLLVAAISNPSITERSVGTSIITQGTPISRCFKDAASEGSLGAASEPVMAFCASKSACLSSSDCAFHDNCASEDFSRLACFAMSFNSRATSLFRGRFSTFAVSQR